MVNAGPVSEEFKKANVSEINTPVAWQRGSLRKSTTSGVAGLFIFQQTFQNYILFFLGVISIMIATIILSRFQAKIEKIETLEIEKE